MQRAMCGLSPACSSFCSTRCSGVAQPANARHRPNAAAMLVFLMTKSYIASVSPAISILLFVATVLGMEGFAYAMHRWVMHGPGWLLHASHHQPRTGWWEANDLYAVLFAIPSIVLLLGGVQLGWGPGAAWVGAGMAAYGALYFGFHDVLVHRRLPHRHAPGSRYFKRIVRAHRLHHATRTKHGAVSFGFLWAPRSDTLTRRSREAALVRRSSRRGQNGAASEGYPAESN